MNNDTYNEVRLGADISDYPGICIDNPTNFNNKIFDCQGYAIDGGGSMDSNGILLEGKENNTIRNCIITDCDHGFMFLGVRNIIIEHNNISSCIGDGIAMWSNSQNVSIKNNFIGYSSAKAIYVYDSHNNTIFNNAILDNLGMQVALESGSSYNNISKNNISITNGENAIYFNNAPHNTISFNYIEAGDYDAAIWLDGDSYDNLITRNFLKGNSNVPGISVVASSSTLERNNVTYNSVSNFSIGIYLYETYDSYVNNNEVHDCQTGISVEFSEGNYINSNEVYDGEDGIVVSNSAQNEIDSNYVHDNRNRGIRLISSSTYNNIANNNLSENPWQILLEGSSDYNIIAGNSISGGDHGIYLSGIGGGGGSHIVFNNNISGCDVGIELKETDNNNITNLLLSNDIDLKVDDLSDSNFFENVTFENTKTTFEHVGAMQMTHASMQGSAPSGMTHIGKFLEIENSSSNLEVNITFFYDNSDLANIEDEGSLGLYKYSGSDWKKIDYSLNTAKNAISANLTNFSIFGIFGEEKTSGGAGGGGGGGYIPPVCGDGKCDSRRESYLNCPADCRAPEEAPENISQDLGDIGEGKSFEGSFAQVFRFRVKGKEHIAQIGKISEDSVILWIWSSPLQVLLNVGQKKQIDLDGNNLAELEILLRKIENGKVFLFLKEIEETMPSAPAPEEKEEAPTTETKRPLPLLPILLVIVVVIIVAIIIWRAREKKLRWFG
ncbi:MAG: right-handed parallel beta-helix repeat-containing protein, partial [Candidatus Pacearchaeota archaeon]|nr:right-handed parallel beta-helix repeat-containing protein [Candidatus Pacearchaeota archaeon]